MSDSKYATNVVCGMRVEIANAAATMTHKGATHHVCFDRRKERFTKHPDKRLH